jgi:hypothetical protein
VVAAIAVPCAISWALSSTNATADISHDVSLLSRLQTTGKLHFSSIQIVGASDTLLLKCSQRA